MALPPPPSSSIITQQAVVRDQFWADAGHHRPGLEPAHDTALAGQLPSTRVLMCGTHSMLFPANIWHRAD